MTDYRIIRTEIRGPVVSREELERATEEGKILYRRAIGRIWLNALGTKAWNERDFEDLEPPKCKACGKPLDLPPPFGKRPP